MFLSFMVETLVDFAVIRNVWYKGCFFDDQSRFRCTTFTITSVQPLGQSNSRPGGSNCFTENFKIRSILRSTCTTWSK